MCIRRLILYFNYDGLTMSATILGSSLQSKNSDKCNLIFVCRMYHTVCSSNLSLVNDYYLVKYIITIQWWSILKLNLSVHNYICIKFCSSSDYQNIWFYLFDCEPNWIKMIKYFWFCLSQLVIIIVDIWWLKLLQLL